MLKALDRCLPASLIGRVYALYSAVLLLFVGSSLALFYQYQYHQAVDEAQDSATMLIELAFQVTISTLPKSDCEIPSRVSSRVKSPPLVSSQLPSQPAPWSSMIR